MQITTATMIKQEVGRLTPSAHEAIQIAQQQAIRMQATSVDPEHLFLGIIIQGDERVLKLLDDLGIDGTAMRRQVPEIAQIQAETGVSEDDLPLSREAQECVRWALAFVAHMHTSIVFPDHLLLGVLRHQRTQPLLAFLLPSIETLQSRISEEIGPIYTHYMDQLIQTRVRDQSIVSYGRGISQRVLRRFERPSTTFIDVTGLDEAKRELRDVVEFLKGTPMFQLSGGRFPHGVLLSGSTANERRLLARATAGEAVVPLITLSLLALVELLVDLQSGELRFEDLALPAREYNLFKRGSTSEKGQRYLQLLFQEAKDVSPSILCLEDIDVLSRLEKREGRDLLMRQLLVEMDALDKHYRTVVMATTERPEDLDPVLLKAGRFERRVILEAYGLEPAARSSFCAACRREVHSDWQFCVYCGTSLAKTCAQCGNPHPGVEGARFCAACGGALT